MAVDLQKPQLAWDALPDPRKRFHRMTRSPGKQDRNIENLPGLQIVRMRRRFDQGFAAAYANAFKSMSDTNVDHGKMTLSRNVLPICPGLSDPLPCA